MNTDVAQQKRREYWNRWVANHPEHLEQKRAYDRDYYRKVRSVRRRTDPEHRRQLIEASRARYSIIRKEKNAERRWRAKLAYDSIHTLREAGWTFRQIADASGATTRSLLYWHARQKPPIPSSTGKILKLRELALSVESAK